MTYYVLYNPMAGNGRGEETANKLKALYPNDELFFRNVTEMGDLPAFLDALKADDRVILCGGDGTLNHFVNDLDGYKPQNEILLYGAGTGNDFMNDRGLPNDAAPFVINEYLTDLPTVTVNGVTRRFINGIGYGIDGYCCEVGDKQRAKDNGKQINYTSIAIKGLLFHYKPTKASVTVDGKLYAFDKTWLAPTMNGRCYGGGMYAAPDQDRLNPERTVTVMVMHSRGKIGTLAAFPSIFTGDHVKKKDIVTTIVGKSVRVEFDRPVALQIDGETVLNVREYEVETAEA